LAADAVGAIPDDKWGHRVELDTETDLAAIDINHRDTDVIADVNLFPELATENQHGATLR
jgi:hypothetical protein